MNDYLRLIRPGLLGLVLFAMAIAGLTAGPSVPAWDVLLSSLLGTGLIIAGAGALNQRIEWRSDATMARTADRPLPAGGLSIRNVTLFGVLSSIAGTVYLAVMSDLTVTVLAVASWCIYVLIYTPLKRVTSWQTAVGAVSGAMPTLLGAAVAGAAFSPMAATLFGIIFCWQFPHTMAIAWLYRREFAAAGVRVATTVDLSGRLAGRLAVAGAVCLLPVSLAPVWFSAVGGIFGGVAGVLGLAELIAAARFLRRRDDQTARTLWRVSLVHLPLLLGTLLWAVRS